MTDDRLNIKATATGTVRAPAMWCHGVTGYLWCLVNAFPDRDDLTDPKRAAVDEFAALREQEAVAALRILQQRRGGRSVWGSEDPRGVTPDLWVGFLGPAVSLALQSAGSRDGLLSAAWLGVCAGLESQGLRRDARIERGAQVAAPASPVQRSRD
jgi:hypothetical protein